MTFIAEKWVEVDDISRWGADGNPEKDKSRSGTKHWKYVTGAVKLAVEQFPEKIRPTERFAFIEALLEFVGNADEL